VPRPRPCRLRGTHLEDVPPVLALIVQPLVEHLHDLDKVIPGGARRWRQVSRRSAELTIEQACEPGRRSSSTETQPRSTRRYIQRKHRQSTAWSLLMGTLRIGWVLSTADRRSKSHAAADPAHSAQLTVVRRPAARAREGGSNQSRVAVSTAGQAELDSAELPTGAGPRSGRQGRCPTAGHAD
jgi:hypothetical protein